MVRAPCWGVRDAAAAERKRREVAKRHKARAHRVRHAAAVAAMRRTAFARDRAAPSPGE
eukprot:gene21113-27464_t